jgi:glucuronosyltransferase
MPSHFQQIFAHVFARIPQRIFWKWEKGSIEEKLTDNIMVIDWLPQQDLLGS